MSDPFKRCQMTLAKILHPSIAVGGVLNLTLDKRVRRLWLKYLHPSIAVGEVFYLTLKRVRRLWLKFLLPSIAVEGVLCLSPLKGARRLRLMVKLTFSHQQQRPTAHVHGTTRPGLPEVEKPVLKLTARQVATNSQWEGAILNVFFSEE